RAFFSGWIIVIITNQSGINKKFLSWNDYYQVTRKMISLFHFGNPFAAIYANSSETNEGFESWRKPSPEMILQASRDLPIDLSKSILIGDRQSDLQAGFNAKIPNLFHVKTGHGEKERETILFDKILIKDIKLINNLKEFPFDILDLS
ncbi:HAD-IIIA family hydrolase, partial [Prochlorococcus sp. AH-716-A09]|nr:HAD-IIIA family hydrolase [Prochlorococcus sp. AH-716-A09]